MNEGASVSFEEATVERSERGAAEATPKSSLPSGIGMGSGVRRGRCRRRVNGTGNILS